VESLDEHCNAEEAAGARVCRLRERHAIVVRLSVAGTWAVVSPIGIKAVRGVDPIGMARRRRRGEGVSPPQLGLSTLPSGACERG
jgi:hypothetical protein